MAHSSAVGFLTQLANLTPSTLDFAKTVRPGKKLLTAKKQQNERATKQA
ncbi:MAG: hypothetical protein R3F51_27330 [Cyanobacteriota/Melainabacteria group bacterium]